MSADNRSSVKSATGDYAQRCLLDLWMALGGDPLTFDEWMAEPRRTTADAWAQLLSAVRGDIVSLIEDTNPPCGELLPVALHHIGGPPQ